MIEELIGQFSLESFSEWCREKFDRFTADPHEVPNAGDFPNEVNRHDNDSTHLAERLIRLITRPSLFCLCLRKAGSDGSV